MQQKKQKKKTKNKTTTTTTTKTNGKTKGKSPILKKKIHGKQRVRNQFKLFKTNK